MKAISLGGAVARVGYPGCGVIAAKSADGASAVLAYFIMGRSTQSKNRVFVEEGGGVKIIPHRPDLAQGGQLLIYSPVYAFENKIIISNGSQTDSVYEALVAGKAFAEALRERSFIPDAPHFTPRLTALVTMNAQDFRLQISFIKAMDAYGASAGRYIFDYENIAAGTGYYLHTFAFDANPLPSYSGEPTQITMSGSIFDTVADIWENLNAENKVALWVRTIDLSTRKGMSRIINKNR